MKNYITPAQFSKVSGIPRRTVYNLLDSGGLNHTLSGKDLPILIDIDSFLTWLETSSTSSYALSVPQYRQAIEQYLND